MFTVEIPADIVIETFDWQLQITRPLVWRKLSKRDGITQRKITTHWLFVNYYTYREKNSAENDMFKRSQANCLWETVQKIPPTIHKGRYSVDKMQLTAPESVFWPRVSGDILRQPKVAMCVKHFMRANSDKHWCQMKFPNYYGSTSWSWLRITGVDFPRS